MNENKYLKIFCTLGFLAFAAVSCWATAESLHLLLSNIPLAICWVVTIGFFFVASWGSKMIVDSFNQNIYLEKRGLRLIGGILILIVFWFICSMPTNTHTFFYRSLIDSKVTHDIAHTQGYLAQIKDNTITEAKIKSKCTEVSNHVKIKLAELEAEIMNESNPGDGIKSQEIRRDIAKLLGVAKIDKLTYRGTTNQDRRILCDEYRKKVLTLLETRLVALVNEMTPPNNNYQKKAEVDYNNLNVVKKSIADGTLNLNDANDIKEVCGKLDAGYATIGTYQQFVTFKDDADKAIYTASSPETKVKRMLSVYDVWMDFFKGEYAGTNLIFWIIVSILVDVAAFIFFDIAFRKKD